MQRLLEAGARHGGHMCGAVIPRRPPASRGGAREPARPRRRRGARGARWRTEVGRSDGRRSEVGGRRSEVGSEDAPWTATRFTSRRIRCNDFVMI